MFKSGCFLFGKHSTHTRTPVQARPNSSNGGAEVNNLGPPTPTPVTATFLSPFSFPLDIFLDILSSLDAKSVTRFKLVSKTWYFYLSHPYFSNLYIESRPSITAFFYKTSQTYAEKIRYVPVHPNQEPIVDPPSCLGFLEDPAVLYDSCNGLLHWHTSWDKHFISNPLTQKFVPVEWPFGENKVFASGIAFDPSVSDHFEVVVLLIASGFSANLLSKSFSSEKMDWGLEKKTSISRAVKKPCCPNRGVFIDGVLYWELKNNYLLAYNVKDNRLDRLVKLPVPKNMSKKIRFSEPGCLGKSKGRLYHCRLIGTLLFVATTWATGHAKKASWVPLHSIELSGLIRCGSSDGPQALAFLDNCRGVLVSLNNEIKAYYFEDGSVKQVCQVTRNGYRLQPSMFFPFVHTLALSSWCRNGFSQEWSGIF